MSMDIVRRIYDGALVLEGASAADERGSSVRFMADELTALTGFVIREQRVYTMPVPHTFFGVHFQAGAHPQSKLISVLHGSGTDFIIDMRRDSPTFGEYEAVELSAQRPLYVYIPAGFGHAFLSREADTIQLFSADEHFTAECGRASGRSIGLPLPDDVVMSAADAAAPPLTEIFKI